MLLPRIDTLSALENRFGFKNVGVDGVIPILEQNSGQKSDFRGLGNPLLAPLAEACGL